MGFHEDKSINYRNGHIGQQISAAASLSAGGCPATKSHTKGDANMYDVPTVGQHCALRYAGMRSHEAPGLGLISLGPSLSCYWHIPGVAMLTPQYMTTLCAGGECLYVPV